MITIYPDDLSHRDRHQLVLGGVSPRPIAFVTSQDAAGNTNLAPFSFFNAFASKPPIVAIGPAVAAKTGREKDTWLNIMETKECTISTVSYSMVHSMNLASSDYPRGVDEYELAGFTKSPSSKVKPPFVAEAPYAMECILFDSIELRRDIGGNGNIVLLEVVAFHVDESVMIDGNIDPYRMDLVGRMGQSYYTRANNIFTATQPAHICIGVQALPDHIRESHVLTGNDLARLAYVQVLPMLDGTFPRFSPDIKADNVEVELSALRPLEALYAAMQQGLHHDRRTMHRIAKVFIEIGQIDDAWQTLLLLA